MYNVLFISNIEYLFELNENLSILTLDGKTSAEGNLRHSSFFLCLEVMGASAHNSNVNYRNMNKLIHNLLPRKQRGESVFVGVTFQKTLCDFMTLLIAFKGEREDFKSIKYSRCPPDNSGETKSSTLTLQTRSHTPLMRLFSEKSCVALMVIVIRKKVQSKIYELM